MKIFIGRLLALGSRFDIFIVAETLENGEKAQKFANFALFLQNYSGMEGGFCKFFTFDFVCVKALHSFR